MLVFMRERLLKHIHSLFSAQRGDSWWVLRQLVVVVLVGTHLSLGSVLYR